MKAGTARAPSSATEVGSTSPQTMPTATASGCDQQRGSGHPTGLGHVGQAGDQADGEEPEQGRPLVGPEHRDDQGQQAQDPSPAAQAEVLACARTHRGIGAFRSGRRSRRGREPPLSTMQPSTASPHGARADGDNSGHSRSRRPPGEASGADSRSDSGPVERRDLVALLAHHHVALELEAGGQLPALLGPVVRAGS